MKTGFCVIISKSRLYQGIALYNSLQSHVNNFTLFVLCVDQEVLNVMNQMNFKNTIPIDIQKLENESLKYIKKIRKVNEYCYTLKPFFLIYVLNNYDDFDNLVYLDADLFFFSDPTPIFDTSKDYSVLISKHNYSFNAREEMLKYGKYNSGFICFKRNEIAYRCLNWWKDQCYNWCRDYPQDGKFTDQKYLEGFPKLFENVHVIETPGVNIAFWNHDQFGFSIKDNIIYVNNDPLIFYHFSFFRVLSKDKYLLCFKHLDVPIMHNRYGLAVKEAISLVEKFCPEFNGFEIESNLKRNNQARVYKIVD